MCENNEHLSSQLINDYMCTMFQGLKELTEALLSENSTGFKNNGNVEDLADARRRLVRYDCLVFSPLAINRYQYVPSSNLLA